MQASEDYSAGAIVTGLQETYALATGSTVARASIASMATAADTAERAMMLVDGEGMRGCCAESLSQGCYIPSRSRPTVGRDDYTI
jgi:hypothetical protein